jgi:signal transduction histidine kinase
MAAREAVARGEHSLNSLLELSRDVSTSTNLYATFDLLLLTIMGQFGTSRAALWLLAGAKRDSTVLTRSHGFDLRMIKRVVDRCEPVLREQLQQTGGPLLSWRLHPALGPSECKLLVDSEVALFAPLLAEGQVLGWIALGPRMNRQPYVPDDLAILQTALGMVSVSLHNTLLNRRLFESNRQLQRSNAHLQELDRLKTDFVNNVNHEIRTPITVVIASLDCLEDVVLDQPARGMLHSALTKSRQLHALLENLLSFSDAINERLPIHLEREDLSTLVRTYYEERLPGVTAELREFHCEAPSGLPPVRVDRQRFRQILDQLVDNAVKFTPRGSHIRLALGCVRHEDRDWIQVTLEDDGPGIPAEQRESLFKSFEQGDGSSTREVGGLGMGLAFASLLAKRMDCLLRSRGEVDRGATFELLVPIVT